MTRILLFAAAVVLAGPVASAEARVRQPARSPTAYMAVSPYAHRLAPPAGPSLPPSADERSSATGGPPGGLGS